MCCVMMSANLFFCVFFSILFSLILGWWGFFLFECLKLNFLN
uniref:Uncharacterized protein n=1 Tax=Anguilla anguilla TaxID=7936 RepID=A0A0E9XRF4_ANGAN